MEMTVQPTTLAHRPSFAELYTPKTITVLREGYSVAALRADVLSGLTVAIVALPLSMAIAIASGAPPQLGLITAIIGGFIISALGGSRFQIGGPAAAFTVLVAASINNHGIEGMLLSTMMAGVFLMLIGFLRLGTYIKYIPYPVTVGFIAGIATILVAGQIHDFLGLTLAVKEPPDLLPKLQALAAGIGTINPAAVLLSVGTVAIISGLKRVRPGWPGILFAVAVCSLAAALFHLPVETIGTRFGGIPGSLPAPHLPAMSLAALQTALPDALTFTLLGAIESLLSAMVADGMTGRRHRSNMELVAQGLANIASALFGGIPATGTVARTATNVRSGARSPIAGMTHSLFLVAFMLIAAPLASYIPLAALSGVLMIVAWNMAERHAIATLFRTSLGDTVVLLATFGLTIFRSLAEGIVVGFTLGVLLFIRRMSQATAIEAQVLYVPDDVADDEGGRTPYDPGVATDPDIAVYRISGAFFFGAAASVGQVLDSIADRHKAFVIDFAAVPFIDSTAANAIAGAAGKASRHGVSVIVSGASAAIRAMLETHGLTAPKVSFSPDVDAAVASAHAMVAARRAA
jgi:SulP family sulfate permease